MPVTKREAWLQSQSSVVTQAVRFTEPPGRRVLHDRARAGSQPADVVQQQRAVLGPDEEALGAIALTRRRSP